jgi:hypothetical protein
MSEKQIPFYTQTALLDEVIHTHDPSADPEMVSIVLDLLRNKKDLRAYFFRSGPSLPWAIILWENGFFSIAPEPEKNYQGYSLPSWDAQYYLISVASQVPEIVLNHIKTVKGHSWYLARAMDALLKIPAKQAETVIPIVLGWLRDEEKRGFLVEEALLLLNSLVEAGRWNAALKLFDNLSAPDQKTIDRQNNGVYGARTFLSELFGSKTNPAFGFESIITKRTESATRILEKHLKKFVLNSMANTPKSRGRIRSWWRAAIENTDQDSNDSYEDLLVSALRDVLDVQVGQDRKQVEGRIAKYLDSRYGIFCRIGLYLLWTHSSTYIRSVKQELVRRKNLDDKDIHHEYFKLMEQCFPLLSSPEKKTLLAMIMDGPNINDIRRLVAWAAKERELNRDVYISNYKKRWIRDRLWMIRASLGKKYTKTLTDLIAEIGEPEYPEFLSWSRGGFVSDMSPFPQEQLSEMSPDDLYKQIHDWNPNSRDNFGLERFSHNGLANEVANVILTHPKKYSARLYDIALLRPEYAGAILGRWTSNEFKGKIPWQIALNLCEEVLKSPTIWGDYKKEVAEATWIGVRLTMASMLENGLSHKERPIPERLLLKAREILLRLVDDPDPSLEADRPPEGWVGYKDYITVGLNHVRPRALMGLITYAVRKAKLDRSHTAEAMMESPVRDALTMRVNPQVDASRAVHSVFGQNILRLHWLDKDWLVQHLDQIFPQSDDEESKWLFIASWEGYILGGYNPLIFGILRSRYRQMIDYIAGGYTSGSYLNMIGRFALHLGFDYMSSEAQQPLASDKESLAVEFVQRTPPDMRKSMGWALWLICRDNPSRKDQYWPKAKAFWEWRTNEATILGHFPDFSPEMGEYSQLLLVAPHFETIKTLRHLLEGLLPYMRGSEYRNQLWNSTEKFLANQVERYPTNCIRFYQSMYEEKSNPPAWIYHSDEAKRIIEVAARNPESRASALSLIDLLARWKDYTFRDIYDRYS